MKRQRREKGSGGVIQRGKRFYARVRAKGEADRLSAACATREEAEALLDRMRQGQHDPRQTPLLKDYYGALIRARNDEPSPHEPPLPSIYRTDARGRILDRVDETTWNGYETNWRVWVCTSPLGSIKIGEIRKKDVQRFVDSVRRDRSWATARKYGSHIHAVLAEAQEDGLIKENPAERIRYGPKTRKKPYVLNRQQMIDVPMQMYEYNPQLCRMILMELDGGMRPAEACGLKVCDLEQPEPGCWGIWVRRSIGRKGEIKGVKDDEERFVYLTDDALEAIKQELDGRRNGFIFLTDQGTPMRPDYLTKQMGRFRRHLQKLMNQRAEDAGEMPSSVPQFTNRGLRRTFATRGVRSGDMKGTQETLGHSTSEMLLDIYAEPEEGAARETVRAIQAKVGYRGLFDTRATDPYTKG